MCVTLESYEYWEVGMVFPSSFLLLWNMKYSAWRSGQGWKAHALHVVCPVGSPAPHSNSRYAQEWAQSSAGCDPESKQTKYVCSWGRTLPRKNVLENLFITKLFPILRRLLKSFIYFNGLFLVFPNKMICFSKHAASRLFGKQSEYLQLLARHVLCRHLSGLFHTCSQRWRRRNAHL